MEIVMDQRLFRKEEEPSKKIGEYGDTAPKSQGFESRVFQVGLSLLFQGEAANLSLQLSLRVATTFS